MTTRLPLVPASFFAIVLGVAGLGNAWRLAHRVWQLPAIVGELLLLAASLVWAVLVILYAVKWIVATADAKAEFNHPVLCCFVGLAGVATMLIGGAALPYSRLAAEILFGVGCLFTVLFMVWRTGELWHGGRTVEQTTPVMYLAPVAGGFVAATVLGALGSPDWARLAFGAGFFAWLSIESVIIHRLYVGAEMPPALRPTMGVQLAPPTVGAVAYLGLGANAPDLLAEMMIGYGLLQALILVRLLPWTAAAGFVPGLWGFSFGASSIAAAPLRFVERGGVGAVASLAPWLFAAANLFIAFLAIGTIRLWLQGRLLGGAPAAGPPK
jgi:tellurite resistance protein